MANFCGKCGRPLADGEVCDCSLEQSSAVNNNTYTASPDYSSQNVGGDMNYQNSNVYAGGVTGNNVNPGYQQPTGGMAQSYQQPTGGMAQAYQQPTEGATQGYQQPYGSMNQGYQQPNGGMTQGYQQSYQQGAQNAAAPTSSANSKFANIDFAAESKNFFGKVVNVLKRPMDGTAELMQKEDSLFGYIAIGAKALIASLIVLLLVLVKIDGVNAFKMFLLSLVALAVVDYVSGWIFYFFGTVIFKAHVSSKSYFALMGTKCVYQAIVIFAAGVFTCLVPRLGSLIFSLGFLYVTVLMFTMYAQLIDVAPNKKALFVWASQVIVAIIGGIFLSIFMNELLTGLLRIMAGGAYLGGSSFSSFY